MGLGGGEYLQGIAGLLSSHFSYTCEHDLIREENYEGSGVLATNGSWTWMLGSLRNSIALGG